MFRYRSVINFHLTQPRRTLARRAAAERAATKTHIYYKHRRFVPLSPLPTIIRKIVLYSQLREVG